MWININPDGTIREEDSRYRDTYTRIDSPSKPETNNGTIYRFFNVKDGRHIFTQNMDEVANLLLDPAWKEEFRHGISITEGVPVYRLVNKASGEILFTADEGECKYHTEVTKKWAYENGGKPVYYASLTETKNPVYRFFNPRATSAKSAHHYTNDPGEIKVLLGKGWKYDNDEKPVYYLGE